MPRSTGAIAALQARIGRSMMELKLHRMGAEGAQDKSLSAAMKGRGRLAVRQNRFLGL
jgi:hypothetical protein